MSGTRSQRLFVAVLPPGPAADELAGAVAPLHRLPGAMDLRWTAREGWHYTLAFLGNVDEELLPALYTRLERAARRTEPFPLRIRGGGRFDGRVLWAGAEGGLGTLRLLAERAARRTEPFPLRIRGGGRFDGRVLWAGAEGGLGTLRLLAERAAAAARRSGIPMEKHQRHTPHLTLARSRAQADLAPYTAALEDFDGTPWEVGEIGLVRSDLPVDGVPGEQPRYGVVRAWPLGG
ncbi:2'-5' RNA ligase family protein [Streptomyces sp. NPDC006682]|uniref:2'-5' RNA ligase family protein n=1 Tax=unclassified Streptomyces TaxID=2593676 RepID=UPI0034551B9A